MVDVYRRTIPEDVVEGARLGRHVHHDPRSQDFVAGTAAVQSVKHEAHGLPLTQARGSCTAESLIGAADSDPNFAGTVREQPEADALYDAEIRLEGGDPAHDDPGGSGLCVCKAAQAAGLIVSYEHAFGVDQALGALSLRPVITGVNWYTSMDSPDERGIVEVSASARVRGGHEVAADEIDAENELVWFWNSWGPSFGLGGRFAMRFATWERLLGEEGDVTVPIFPAVPAPS